MSTRTIYMTCVENRVEDNYDGGLVMLAGIRAGVGNDLLDARLVMSHAHDETMRDYPVTREEKQRRFFRVVVEEVSIDDLPPDPSPPSLPDPREQAKLPSGVV